MHRPFCGSERPRVHRGNGHAYSTMYRFVPWNRFFSEQRFTGRSGLKPPPGGIVRIVNRLVEGIPVRAAARLVDVEKKAVLRAVLQAAKPCRGVMDNQLRNLSLRRLQADELWSFAGKKEENVTPCERKNGHSIGDTWVLLITDRI